MEGSQSESSAATAELPNEQHLDDSAMELNLGLEYDSDIGESKDVLLEDANDDSQNGNSVQDSESSEEEGELSPVKDNELKKIYHQKDKDKDDGELSDDDIEEGEVKDTPASNQQTRRICHFFNRGNCTWGNQCRFLHLSVKERGFYDMFGQSRNSAFPCTSYPNRMAPRTVPIRYIPPYNSTMDLVDYSPPLPVDKVTIPDDNGWDRGLEYAKEVIKISKERKQQEVCYEEKKLRLNFNELEEHDKENYCRSSSPYVRDHDELIGDVYRHQNEYRNKYSYSNQRMSVEQKPYSRDWKRHGNQRAEIQTDKRDEEWRDPWRRSKSPKEFQQRSSSHSSVSSRSTYSSHSSDHESSSHSSLHNSKNYQNPKKVIHRSVSRQRSLSYQSRTSSERSTATRSRSMSKDRLSLSSISSTNSSHKSEPPDDYSSRKVTSTQKPKRSYQPPMTRTLYEEMQRLQRRKLKEKRNSSPGSTKERKTNKRAASPESDLKNDNKSNRLKDISSRRAELVKQLKVLDAAISKKRAKH